MTTLYKKDNTGSIRVWEIEADFDQMVITHGVMHGALTTKAVPVMINQSGRSLDEQMDLEINSRVNKQLDRGYSLDIDQAMNKGMSNSLDLPLPMLAQPINKVKASTDSYYCQYKYDGMRCLIHHGKDGLVAYSRGGKRIETIRHITDELQIPQGQTVDGELYLHDTPLQTIMSLAKRYQPATKELNYMLYDTVINAGYTKRFANIQRIASNSGSSVKLAPTLVTNPRMDIFKTLEEAQRMGYEGLILRNPTTPYEAGKRSPSLIKVKTVEDDEFVIVNITGSVDGHAILHCNNFSVLAPGTHDFKHHVYMHPNNYIGRMVRVEFANRTKDGVPFHPVATNIADD